MDMQPPPAFVQVAQAEVPPDAPVEPTPIEVNVSKYIPELAISVTMIVTLSPPTGQAVIYAAGNEKGGTLFKGPRSIDEVRLCRPTDLCEALWRNELRYPIHQLSAARVSAAFSPLRTNDAVGHSTPEQLFENALAAQRRGSLADAKRLYASVLRY